MVSLYGLVCFVCLVLGGMNKGIRNIDIDLPDVEGDDELKDKQGSNVSGAAV